MMMLMAAGCYATVQQKERDHKDAQSSVKKVLFIGDSMTGWLAERLNAYGEENGFEVATVVWDGSTIQKWGSSPRLSKIIAQQEADAIFVSLGMNELFEANPEKRLGTSVNKILSAAGDTPVIWVGPPSWPGHKQGKTLVNWLDSKLGDGHFFNSFGLELPKQSVRNPHPTRAGMVKWMDAVVEWLQNDGAVKLQDAKKPAAGKMSRGKTFIYKRMKESL